MAAFALSGLQKSHAHGQNRARFFPLAPLGLRNPHKIMRARTVPSPLWGEGEGEGKHAALRGIPFTLCFLLFCRSRTRERARAVHRHRPGDPGSRPGKSPLARSTQRIPSGLSGTVEGNVPVKSPSPRIPARRPGPADTLRRFSAGPTTPHLLCKISIAGWRLSPYPAYRKVMHMGKTGRAFPPRPSGERAG
jgi:hypothetical protein